MSEVVTRVETNRPLGIGTPLGENKLLVVDVHGTEALGRLFEFELDLVSEEELVDYAKLLGQNVTIRLNLVDGEKMRYINGFVSRFSFTGLDDTRKDAKRIFFYRATLVPWTWFLTRHANCRIFQQKSIPDIIKQVCNDRGFTDLDMQLSGNYAAWDYCVQYRETDFNFISRLMENEGIYYYFTHEDGKHKMVLCDARTAHQAAEGAASLHFDEPDLKTKEDTFIWDWTIGHEVTPTKVVLHDFNMIEPQTDLLRSKDLDHSHDSGKYEVFDYPGGYQKGDDGVKYAQVRLEEAEAEYALAHATTAARPVHAGVIFTLEDHPVLDAEEYLVTGASYHMHNDDLGLGLPRQSGPVYRAQLTCIPKGCEFRTRRLTPKPVVQGPQTALVVGPSGDEIYVDKYGRVKVQFHWDREGKQDENSSCWIRVSQPWAGKKWGAVSIPRIGQEVIVEFLEGDPDRPIITGRVYNGENMPPHELPGFGHSMSLKTNSSPGGGNFNEIRLTDEKDEEQMFIYAGKNYDMRVKNDRFENVEHDMHVTVTNDSFLEIQNKWHVKVASDVYQEFQADVHETITGNNYVDIGGNRSTKIAGNENTSIDGSKKEKVSGSCSLKVDGDLMIDATGSVTIKCGGGSISMGSDGIKIETDSEFTAKAGSAATMEASGDATVAAKGNATLEATGAAKVSGTGSTSVESAGSTTVKGSMVMIN
jgi:type VI secretion system secreted protein VgrG